MAFLDIPDATKREEIVKDFIKIRNELWEKSENRKVTDDLSYKAFEKQYKPILDTSKANTEKINSTTKESAQQISL